MTKLKNVQAAMLCFAALTTPAFAHHTELVLAPEYSLQPRQKPAFPVDALASVATVYDTFYSQTGVTTAMTSYGYDAALSNAIVEILPNAQPDYSPIDVTNAMTSYDYVAALSNAIVEIQPDTQPETNRARSLCVVTNTNRCKSAKDAKKKSASVDGRFEGSVNDFIRMRNGLPALTEVSQGGIADIQIDFPPGSVVLTETAKANIDQLALALNDARFANSKMQIQGAVNEFGSEATNAQISQLRADLVVERLELLGVQRWRLFAVGIGSSTGQNNVQVVLGL